MEIPQTNAPNEVSFQPAEGRGRGSSYSAALGALQPHQHSAKAAELCARRLGGTAESHTCSEGSTGLAGEQNVTFFILESGIKLEHQQVCQTSDCDPNYPGNFSRPI